MPPSEKLDFTAGGHGEPDVWLPRLHRLLCRASSVRSGSSRAP